MKKVVITLLVLVGLLVAADFGTAAAAEYHVSQQMRTELSLPTDPSVRINGFPFLTQAISGDYRDIAVSADRIQYGVLQLSLRADLHGVRVPLSAVLGGSVTTIRVADAEGTVLIQPADLADLLGVSGLRVSPVSASELDGLRTQAAQDPSGSSGDAAALATVKPADAIQLVATTAVTGQPVEVSVIASLDLVGQAIEITAHDVRIGTGGKPDKPLPEAEERSLLAAFSTRIDPGKLPFGVKPTAVTVTDGALAISGVVHGLVVSADPRTGQTQP